MKNLSDTAARLLITAVGVLFAYGIYQLKRSHIELDANFYGIAAFLLVSMGGHGGVYLRRWCADSARKHALAAIQADKEETAKAKAAAGVSS